MVLRQNVDLLCRNKRLTDNSEDAYKVSNTGLSVSLIFTTFQRMLVSAIPDENVIMLIVPYLIRQRIVAIRSVHNSNHPGRYKLLPHRFILFFSLNKFSYNTLNEKKCQ